MAFTVVGKNNIGSISITEGYKLKTSFKDSIEIEGYQQEYPIAIPLKYGWNIVGYPQNVAYNGMDLVVQELIAKRTLEKVQDEKGNAIEDWGSFGGWKNFIGDFIPGEGYKVKVNTVDTLWIFESYPKSVADYLKIVSSTYFQPAYSGNGFNHMNINLVNLSEAELCEGDEIGLFDGDLCVGAAKITNQIIKENKISIPVSANDDTEVKDGFIENQTISAKIYRKGIEYPFTIVPLDGRTPIFKKNSSLFASADIISGINETAGIMKVKCYPGIFSDEVHIRITSTGYISLNVDVYNLNGQIVKKLYHGNLYGSSSLIWNGDTDNNRKVFPGLYIIMVNNQPFKVIYYDE